MDIYGKKEKLTEIIGSLGKTVIAFSGGVDSSFLLIMCKNILGDGAAALTALSPVISMREQEQAESFCKSYGIRQIILRPDILSLDVFASNPPDRCYHCKKELFSALIREAKKEGFATVAEGSNLDDTGDYRPGMRALEELKIRSPLLEAGLTKEDIRTLSKELGLPTADKPSLACLATRIAYGEAITPDKLGMIEKAEDYLRDMGFGQVRVRMQGNAARIEIEPSRLPEITQGERAGEINRRLRELGFSFVSLDLGGYKTGSMNRELK